MKKDLEISHEQLNLNSVEEKEVHVRVQDMSFLESLKCSMSSITESDASQVIQVKKKKLTSIFLPAYLRLRIRNITSMNDQNLQSQVQSKIMLSIFYGQLDDQAVQFICSGLLLNFYQETIKLSELKQSEIWNDHHGKMLHFSLAKSFIARLEKEIFWSPIERAKIIFSVKVPNLKLKKRGLEFRFNLMDCEDISIRFETPLTPTFGYFECQSNNIFVECSNNKSCSKSIQIKNLENPYHQAFPCLRQKLNETDESSEAFVQSILKMAYDQSKKSPQNEQNQALKQVALHQSHNYKYAHFVLPMSKKPTASAVTIYFPIILLSIINIGVFYDDPLAKGKRMLNIGALMISYVALLPTVRKQTQNIPIVTITEIFVFLNALTTAFALASTLEVRKNQNYEADAFTDGWLFASVIIPIITVVFAFGLVVFHKCHFKKQYKSQEVSRLCNFEQLNRADWHTDEKCNRLLWKQMVKAELDSQNATQKLGYRDVEKILQKIFTLSHPTNQSKEKALQQKHQMQRDYNSKQALYQETNNNDSRQAFDFEIIKKSFSSRERNEIDD